MLKSAEEGWSALHCIVIMLMLSSVTPSCRNAHLAKNEAFNVPDTELDSNSSRNEVVARKARRTIRALRRLISNRFLQPTRQQL